MMRTMAVLVIGAALAFAACGSDDEPDAGSTETSQPDDQDVAPTDTEATPDDADGTGEDGADVDAVFGTWDNPLPAGTPIMFDNWDITIGPAMTTADALITDGSAAEPGTVYLYAEMTAIRLGEMPDTLTSFDGGVIVTAMGGDGVEHSDVCGTDNDIDTVADVALDGMLTGDVCSIIPDDAVDGAVWMVSEQGTGVTAYVAQS